ncbi:MAG: M36 family metallopeptidase [Myxococcota bacterium]|nr:M36 family metallopeptidase [Myxococcota bacterium]
MNIHLKSAAAFLSLALASGCIDNKPANEGIVILTPDASLSADAAIRPIDLGGQEPQINYPLLDEPLASVYLNDPTTDEGTLSEVTVEKSAHPEGALTSPWVQVFNCLNEEGGVVAMPDVGGFNISIALCNEVQTVRPDPDGHYLSIAPPDQDSDPNDQFAEIMMYHHVNQAHDYFKDVHGFAELDYPLPALVNVQIQVDPPLPFLNPGPDGWIGLSNAAFFPKEAWRQFASQFGLPPRDSDSIVFFQGDLDFAYDSRVIYHEYTHAVVGTNRLSVGAVLDEYGLDMSPRSMNEGLADFFAASISNDPVIGKYVGVMGLGLRDLSNVKICPDDTVDEVHAQGEIIGSTLWSLREAVGSEIAESIAYLALEQFTYGTNHAAAAALMLGVAADFGPDVEAQAADIFARHGFGSCERSLGWSRFNAGRNALPHLVEGTQSAGVSGFVDGVPAFKQFHVRPQDGTSAVRLSWSVSAGGQGPVPGFGGGGSASPLSLMVRKDTPIAVTAGRPVQFDYEYKFTPALNGSNQALTLAANCLPDSGQKLHTLFLNPGASQVQITSMNVEYLDALPETGVETCGAAEPDNPDMGNAQDSESDVDDVADAGIDAEGDAE